LALALRILGGKGWPKPLNGEIKEGPTGANLVGRIIPSYVSPLGKIKPPLLKNFPPNLEGPSL